MLPAADDDPATIHHADDHEEPELATVIEGLGKNKCWKGYALISSQELMEMQLQQPDEQALPAKQKRVAKKDDIYSFY